MMKKKMLPPFLVPIKNPFADNSAGFSGVFPGSLPDLIGPASRPSISFLFPASICLGAGRPRLIPSFPWINFSSDGAGAY